MFVFKHFIEFFNRKPIPDRPMSVFLFVAGNLADIHRAFVPPVDGN